MKSRISGSHLILLLIIAAFTIFVNYSAIQASQKLFNLIVVVPSGLLILALVIFLLAKVLTGKAEQTGEKDSNLVSDLVLLSAFGLFCLAMTNIGFDIATFIFVWLGIHLCGERNLFIPPVFSALFTLLLVKGFGALFPYPMPLLVL